MENETASQAAGLVGLAVDRFNQRIALLKGHAFRAGYQITCGRKCSACCSEPALATKQEVQVLAEAFQTLPAGDKERILSDLRQWLDKFDAAGLGNVDPVGLFAYRAARLPCPFLKDQECSVYESRPLCCRGHFAVGPRENCEDDKLRPDQDFLEVGAVMAECAAVMLEHEDLVFDHIGIWLAELLLGQERPSRGRKGLKVTNR